MSEPDSVKSQLEDGQWHYELITPGLIQVERVNEVYYEGKTAFQHVVVQDTACFGRSLVLDSKTQSTEADEFVYHEALAQPCMVAHPNPRHVFVAGGGEGATIREALSHSSVQKVVMVDIDREVVELCRKHLPSHHRGSFDDPRLELVYDDALKYLEETELRFDVAIIDVPDPIEAGPAYVLFTREFYELLKDRLNPGGLMVAQSGPTGPAFYEQCFSAVASTVGSVFPAVYTCEAFVPAFGTTWGFVIGSLGPDVAALSPEEVDRRIAERVAGKLRFYDGITHRGMFSVPKYLREAVARERRIITRADPLFVV
ncbi:MAG: polyamine aminopropyltransferase [Chloroflexi bacterium]|nr:polyamine aminopropyltransferase [Chloroflexota bacterium]